MSAYIQSRAAAADGALGAAAESAALALAAQPDNALLASQAFSRALAAGDRNRAAAAARILDIMGEARADVRLMLLSEALIARDWDEASRQADLVARDDLFGFMAGIARGWIARGSGEGDPIALLEEAAGDETNGRYGAEHRALMLVALGRPEGAAAIAGQADLSGGRGVRLRLAGAAALGQRRATRPAALALLEGASPALDAARARIARGRPVPGAVTAPAEGMGELFVDLATDLHRQEIADLALLFARLSTFLAPGNGFNWLVTADILSEDDPRAALALLDRVDAADPFAFMAADARIAYLTEAGARDEALALVEARVGGGGAAADWVRIGELRDALGHADKAADAYARAIAAGDEALPGWALHLMRGDVLFRAGDWTGAREALEAARGLAPEEPLVLNYLGYAKLERREDLDEAAALIREAVRRDPDNAAIQDSMGWAYFVRGEHDAAIPYLERAAEGEPADPLIHEHLGDAYYSAGRRLEARHAWRAALVFAEEEAAGRLRAKIEGGFGPDTIAP